MAHKSDIRIFYCDTERLDSAALAAAASHLSIKEQDRRDRLHFEADRRDFTIAHSLLRQSLSAHAGVTPSDWRFDVDRYGKPSIANCDPRAKALSFSLSHTRGCVACAITEEVPLGIDLERIDESLRVQEIADRYFSEEEAAWLSQCSDEQRNTAFTELWTLKEALLKAIGIGLSASLKKVSFRFGHYARIEFSAPFTFRPNEWHFALFEPSRDVRLAVCVQSATTPYFTMSSCERNGYAVVPIRTSAPLLRKQTFEGDRSPLPICGPYLPIYSAKL